MTSFTVKLLTMSTSPHKLKYFLINIDNQSAQEWMRANVDTTEDVINK